MSVDQDQSDSATLQTFLATRDEPCPLCNYNLRGLQGQHCPECGHQLCLSEFQTEPDETLSSLPTLFALTAVGIPMLVSYFTAAIFLATALDGNETTIIICLAVIATVAVLIARKAFQRIRNSRFVVTTITEPTSGIGSVMRIYTWVVFYLSLSILFVLSMVVLSKV